MSYHFDRQVWKALPPSQRMWYMLHLLTVSAGRGLSWVANKVLR